MKPVYIRPRYKLSVDLNQQRLPQEAAHYRGSTVDVNAYISILRNSIRNNLKELPHDRIYEDFLRLFRFISSASISASWPPYPPDFQICPQLSQSHQ